MERHLQKTCILTCVNLSESNTSITLILVIRVDSHTISFYNIAYI